MMLIYKRMNHMHMLSCERVGSTHWKRYGRYYTTGRHSAITCNKTLYYASHLHPTHLILLRSVKIEARLSLNIYLPAFYTH